MSRPSRHAVWSVAAVLAGLLLWWAASHAPGVEVAPMRVVSRPSVDVARTPRALRAPVLDVGEPRAVRPTGLRVRLSGVRPGAAERYAVRIQRVVAEDPRDVERASQLLPVVRHVAPGLASALQDGTPVPLAADGDTLLSPLLPDRAVRLWLRTEAGRESEPVEVPLSEGRVETVVLEPSRLLP